MRKITRKQTPNPASNGPTATRVEWLQDHRATVPPVASEAGKAEVSRKRRMRAVARRGLLFAD